MYMYIHNTLEETAHTESSGRNLIVIRTSNNCRAADSMIVHVGAVLYRTVWLTGSLSSFLLLQLSPYCGAQCMLHQ